MLHLSRVCLFRQVAFRFALLFPFLASTSPSEHNNHTEIGIFCQTEELLIANSLMVNDAQFRLGKKNTNSYEARDK